jgi:hypothetical protein
MPAVDAQSKKFNKLNFLLWLDTDVSNYTFGAWVDDVLVGLNHFTHWHKHFWALSTRRIQWV